MAAAFALKATFPFTPTTRTFFSSPGISIPSPDISGTYAFIENVITDEAYRKKGLATKCLNYAKKIAIKENCYKMMLLTGSKKDTTLQFYQNAGYNSEDKTAFIQWI